MAESSLRTERVETSRLAWSFVISLVIHLLILGIAYTGHKYDLWSKLSLPGWLRPKNLIQTAKPVSPPQPRQEMLVYLDVSPAQATAEPPKDAKFYSDKNSKAANPDADTESNMPKVTGEQTQIVKAEDVPRIKPAPLQPAPSPPTPPPEIPQEPQEEQKAKATEAPGDLALAKPEENPRAAEGQDQKSRPRRLAEALARRAAVNDVPGQKMKEEGGVRRRLDITSFDAKSSDVGIYDSELVNAVRWSWYAELDKQRYASDYRGKVVLQFRLHHDGTVTDLRVVENTAGPIPGLICETAVDKPQPFEKFPAHMRFRVGDTREILFTFYYN